MKEKKSFFKEHKKEIIVGVSLAAAGVAGYLIYKNKDALQEAVVNFGKAKNTIKELSVVNNEAAEIDFAATKEVLKTIDVSSHIRKLPEGQHPSAKKITFAIEKSIELGENETIVSAYQRTQRIAA